MGISSKKSKTTTNQTTSGTTSMTQTPTNPEWVTSGLQGLGGQISDLSKLDPYSLVAGPDKLQTQAGQGASGLTTSPYFGQGADMLKGVAGAGANTYNPAMMGDVGKVSGASGLTNLSAWMNPYTNDVVNTTLAGFDENAGRTRASQQLDLANDSTFGGSGGSILRSLTERGLAQDRAGTEASLRDQAFNTAAGYSSQDADRTQQASLANLSADLTRATANQNALNQGGQFNAGQHDADLSRQLAVGEGLAGIGTAAGAEGRSNLTTQADIGAMLQALAQQKAGAPMAQTGALAQMFGSLPLGLTHGTQSDGTMTGSLDETKTGKESGAALSDWLQYFAANAQAAASAGASDERLKQDIETVGYDGKGRRWVEWTYRFWPGQRFLGVVAQEVQKTDPRAVREGPGGFLFVDYAQLGA
jgi:hypothetical protein